MNYLRVGTFFSHFQWDGERWDSGTKSPPETFYLFIYFNFWLCWVFVSVRGLSLAVASGGHSSSRCAGLSLSRPLLLRSTGSRRTGSVVVAHGPSCSTACGIFPDQGSNPYPLHWQADSQPLRHQGSPWKHFKWLTNVSAPVPQALRVKAHFWGVMYSVRNGERTLCILYPSNTL